MTPSAHLLYPWQVQLSEHPRHAEAGHFITLGTGTATRTLAVLRYNEIPISPVLACVLHSQHFIPVENDQDAAWPLLREAGCQLTDTTDCSIAPRLRAPLAHGRLWILPPEDVPQAPRTPLRPLLEAYRLQKKLSAGQHPATEFLASSSLIEAV